MAALIILVNAVARTLRHTEALLSDRGHLVAALDSFEQARNLLDSVTPDLLIADVRLGAYNGLQLAARSRFDHPDVPVIVTSAQPDEIAAQQAERFDAMFIAAPLENPDFVPMVEAALAKRRDEQPFIRRWFRAPAARRVEVHAAAARAQIVDVSYGGVRLAFKDGSEIPATFDISIPPAGVLVKAQRVWTAPSDSGDTVWCGAELVGEPEGDWRRFIESVRDVSGA